MPFGFKVRDRIKGALEETATAVATGVHQVHGVARNEEGRGEALVHRAQGSAEAAGRAARTYIADSRGSKSPTRTDRPPKPTGEGNVSLIPPDSVGRTMSDWGFSPLRPVALFNSLSGCQTEVVSSSYMPGWEGSVLWVEPTKLGGAAVSNIASQATRARATARDLEWRRRLLMVMDRNGDEEIDPDELASFCAGSDGLRDDPHVVAVLGNRGDKSTDELLDELGPAFREKLTASLLEERDYHESSHIQTGENRISNHQWTRHMQLVDGWRDPKGIKVRPRAGLGAMECLVANDTTGLAAKLGAGLMIGVTSQLRSIGYEEGRNLLPCGYDWRAPCTKLEERDGHFSKVMDDVECLVTTNGGERAVVVTHSLGGVCAHYFFHWVANSDQGRAHGGVGWLDKHIHSFVPIGGPLLGTPFGSHSFLCGDEGQGIAPLLVSFANRHLLIRSWGMFGMIFPSGRHLMLQPTRSPHWVRREGVLRVHVLAVKVPDDHRFLTNRKTRTRTDELRKHTIHLTFQPPETDIAHRLKTSAHKMRTDAAFDEQFQFAWSTTPMSVDGARLTLSLNRLREAKIRTVLTGAVDEPVSSGTFRLGCGGTVRPPNTVGPCEGLEPDRWSERRVTLEGGVVVTLRLRFRPHSATGGPGDFTRAAAGDPGAWRCGGPADSCTSDEKQARMVRVLGAEEGSEWRPTPASSGRTTRREEAQHGRAAYDPARVDEVMVMDGMRHEYDCWQRCYADDPIWRGSTEAPPIQRVRPIYGINVPTLIGSIFRRQTKRYERDEPTTGLKLDRHCDVSHPGYSVRNGVVYEVPHKTPQADDPTVPPGEMTYQTRASGDGTVAYWSLRWPVAWRGAGVHVEGPLEVEGAGHRDILQRPECIAAVLSECCHHPVRYAEVTLHGIYAPMHPPDARIVLEMNWRGAQLSTETAAASASAKTDGARKPGGATEARPFAKQRFVLGITQSDIDSDRTLVVRALASLDDILKGTVPVTVPVGGLVSGKVPSFLNFDEGGELSLSWSLQCYPADENGMPKQ